jgi:hypothetical protein
MSLASNNAPVAHQGRRNLPGTSCRTLFTWNIEEKFENMQGQFATQEYIQHLIRQDYKNVVGICKLPDGQAKAVWILEHLRQMLSELNLLCVALDDVCTTSSCPKMVATKDWEFLCAAHEKPKECCAIDYFLHALNGFTALLNNPEMFPSRAKVSPQSTQCFVSIARRLYRVFAHAYFHHRPEFDRFERETALTRRFKHFTLEFGLMTVRMFVPDILLDDSPASGQ